RSPMGVQPCGLGQTPFLHRLPTRGSTEKPTQGNRQDFQERREFTARPARIRERAKGIGTARHGATSVPRMQNRIPDAFQQGLTKSIGAPCHVYLTADVFSSYNGSMTKRATSALEGAYPAGRARARRGVQRRNSAKKRVK